MHLTLWNARLVLLRHAPGDHRLVTARKRIRRGRLPEARDLLRRVNQDLQAAGVHTCIRITETSLTWAHVHNMEETPCPQPWHPRP